MITFATGIACLATLLGFLVGASESPVAGIALTATFGIVATGLALHQRAAGESPADLPKVAGVVPGEGNLNRALRSLGVVLVTFSLTFGIGLSVGVYTKLKSHEVQLEASLPWQGLQPPTSARKAIDWILVRKRLREHGYSDPQIVELYKIDLAVRKSDDKAIGWGSTDDQLLSPILSAAPATPAPQSKGNYIAMDPKLMERSGGV